MPICIPVNCRTIDSMIENIALTTPMPVLSPKAMAQSTPLYPNNPKFHAARSVCGYKIINKGSIAPVSVYRAFIRELIRIPKRKNNPESISPDRYLSRMNGKYPLLVQAFPTMKITVKKGIDNDTQQAEAIQQK
jgi:hypothetical protein